MPILYDKLLDLMKQKGITSYTLKKDNIIGQATFKKIKEGGDIDTRTIGKLCGLLDCQPGDILDFEPENISNEDIAMKDTPRVNIIFNPVHEYVKPLTNEEWELIVSLMTSRIGGAPIENRIILDAIFYRFRSPCKWYSLPQVYTSYVDLEKVIEKFSEWFDIQLLYDICMELEYFTEYEKMAGIRMREKATGIPSP